MRSRLLWAILLGSSVTVLPGERVGGSFQTIPACTSAEESGCVVSHATYAGEPPANGIFGRWRPNGRPCASARRRCWAEGAT